MSKKQKPQVIVEVIECKDLIPDPNAYWKKHNRFSCYAVVTFQGTTKKTKEVQTDKPQTPLPPWKETFTFSVDEKKLTNGQPVTVVVEVWQKKWKEYFEKNKDVQLGKVEILLTVIEDDKPFQTWIKLNTGYLSLSITRKGLNQYFPTQAYPQTFAPPPAPSTTPAAPVFFPEVRETQQSQPALQPPQYNVPTPQAFPQSSPYPPPYTPQPAYNPQSQPVYNPQSQPAYNPQAQPAYNPQAFQPQPSAPVELAPPVYNTPPSYPPQNTSSPPLPPKVTLPDEVNNKTVFANTSLAPQQVSEQILSQYFKFCGTVQYLVTDGPFAIISFEKEYEADTAVLLDNGVVCGGPILVARYKDLNSKIKENQRQQVEKLATKFLDVLKKSPAPQKSSNETPAISKDEALNSLPAETTQSSVYVTNISKQATVDILVDFFSYCGPVTNTQLFKENDEVQYAVVHFSTTEAANAALLLTNAFIYDRPIQVQQFTAELEKSLKDKKPIASSSESPNSNSSGGSKTKSSIVASIAAAGYNVGASAISKAKAYDEKHLGSAVSSTLATAKAKVQSFNEKYEISKKADRFVSSVKSFIP